MSNNGPVHYTLRLNYPASVSQVSQMLADPAFARYAAEQTTPDGKVLLVDITGDTATGFTAAVRRRIPNTWIPPQFRAFAGAEIEIRQAEVWEPEIDGQRLGTVSLEIVGTPLIMTGTVKLVPTETGTAQIYEGDIKANIPFIGAAIEAAAEQPVQEALKATQQAGNDWLSKLNR